MKPARLAVIRAVSSLRNMPDPVAIQGVRADGDALRAPVIVNPMAEAEGLMVWSVDQLTAVNQLLASMAGSSPSGDVAAFAGAVAHFTVQAEAAVRAALQVHRDSFMD